MRKPSLANAKEHLEHFNNTFRGNTLRLVLYLYTETYLNGKGRTQALKRDQIATGLACSADSVKKCSAKLIKAGHLSVTAVRPRSHSAYYKLMLPKQAKVVKTVPDTTEKRKAWLDKQKKKRGPNRKLNIPGINRG